MTADRMETVGQWNQSRTFYFVLRQVLIFGYGINPVLRLDHALVQNQAALSSQPQTIELAVVFDHNFLSALGKLVKTDFTGALIGLACSGIRVRLFISGGSHESAPMRTTVETASQQCLPAFKKTETDEGKHLDPADRMTKILRLNLSVNTP